MSRYKLILELAPDLEAAKQKKIIEEAKRFVEAAGGNVGEVANRGLTKLSFPIEDKTECFLNLAKVEVGGGELDALKKKLDAESGVLRVMFVKEEVKKG